MVAIDTNFERLRRAMLRQGEGDRVPLFEMSIHQDLKAAILGRPLHDPRDEVEFWRTAGYDFVSVRAGVRSVVRGYHPAVRAWRQAHHGIHSQASGWVVEDEALIRDRRDFQEFPWPKPKDLDSYDDYEDLDDHLTTMARLLPPGMKLLVQLGYIFMGAWQLMGFENYCLHLADDPDLVRDVTGWLGASQLAVLDILLQHDCVGTIWLPDDLCYNSGPVVSPRIYHRYVYPWYVKIVERCHRAGIPVGLHSDGDLNRLLPDLVACGFDAIHPFEPPMNDIVTVKRQWGHRVAVAGNIDLKKTLGHGTPQDVEAEVRQKATVLAPGGGWLLGSSNSIPDFVPVANYKALLAASLKYGRYPSRENARSARSPRPGGVRPGTGLGARKHFPIQQENVALLPPAPGGSVTRPPVTDRLGASSDFSTHQENTRPAAGLRSQPPSPGALSQGRGSEQKRIYFPIHQEKE